MRGYSALIERDYKSGRAMAVYARALGVTPTHLTRVSRQASGLTAADFRSFVDTQELVASAYRDQERWTRMSILNTANSGKFSTDRTMRDYNSEIWHLSPIAPGPL